MWGQHLQGVSYFLDIIAFCNKCVLISTCQSCEKVANFGKGSSYKILNNAIQILLSERTSLIEIFCLVLDVKNFVFSSDYNTKDGIGVSDLACKDVFRFLSLFITCTFILVVHKESCIKSCELAYLSDHNIFVWYLNLIKMDFILGVLGLSLCSCARFSHMSFNVAMFKLFTTPNIGKETIFDMWFNVYLGLGFVCNICCKSRREFGENVTTTTMEGDDQNIYFFHKQDELQYFKFLQKLNGCFLFSLQSNFVV